MSTDFIELAEMIDELIERGELALFVQSLVLSCAIYLIALAVFFVLEAIGLYRINRRLGNKGAALAFIPGLSGYALGAAADGLRKQKPSNYCVHMLMLKSFYLIANLVYTYKTFGRFLLLYEHLRVGTDTDTLTLLQETMTVDASDVVFMVAYYAVNVLSYVVLFVSLLCYMRILQLFRTRNGFFLLIGAMLAPQVMSVYLFAARNREIYRKPPVFRMPGMDPDDTDGTDDTDGDTPPFDPYYDPREEEPPEYDYDEPSDEDSADGEASDASELPKDPEYPQDSQGNASADGDPKDDDQDHA